MERNDDEFRHGQGITTTEMAVGKYRKRLLQSCFYFGVPMGAIGALVIEHYWFQILSGFWDLSLRNWWLIPTIVVIIGLVLVINRPGRRKTGGASKRENQAKPQAK